MVGRAASERLSGHQRACERVACLAASASADACIRPEGLVESWEGWWTAERTGKGGGVAGEGGRGYGVEAVAGTELGDWSPRTVTPSCAELRVDTK